MQALTVAIGDSFDTNSFALTVSPRDVAGGGARVAQTASAIFIGGGIMVANLVPNSGLIQLNAPRPIGAASTFYDIDLDSGAVHNLEGPDHRRQQPRIHHR